jgi:enoyl-CoA hydratase
MAETISYDCSGDVAIVGIDDGKANALSPDLMRGIHGALDRAEKDGAGVLLIGRPKRFSAGFDLGVMTKGGPDAARAMVRDGAELAVRIARHPAPVVIGCTGHALAMGAVLLLSADLRIGVRGDFKLGFNEVAIQMTTPVFLMEFARERLSKRHLQRATVQAEIYGPEAAVDAGFLDRVVEPEELLETAKAETKRLAVLPRAAFVATRAKARSGVIERIEATLTADLTGTL